MKIEIMNREDARKESFKKNAPTTAIISISNIAAENNIFNYSEWLKAVLYVNFDDEESYSPNSIKKFDADNICGFVNRIKDKVERIIVHCEAGVSRSAGVGAAIMKFLNGDDMPIFNNGRFRPNMTCYRIVLNTFMDNDK